MKTVARVLVWSSLLFVLGSGAYAAAQAVDPAEADGVIFDRQQIMKRLDKDADTLGRIVAGELPADNLAATAHAIAQGAKDSADAFKTKAPGGRSKPEVWSNSADFSKRMDAFVRSSDAMAKVADTGDVVAVTSVMGDALPCKECHDTYREPKKSP